MRAQWGIFGAFDPTRTLPWALSWLRLSTRLLTAPHHIRIALFGRGVLRQTGAQFLEGCVLQSIVKPAPPPLGTDESSVPQDAKVVGEEVSSNRTDS